ncbi:MAG TPA: hypothetical protein VFV19_06975 [Candidatus Polarisedimenticolaceae bacterium]|nr:hypothetical protein [Candidatus Polarisedimenticolaceae bacterium]
MRQLRWFTAVVSIVLLGSAVLAAGGSAPIVRTASVQGRTLVVGVVNPSPLPFRGIVMSRVRTAHGVATVITRFEVAGSQTATLKSDLPKDASGEPPLSVVVDDGVPF